MLVLPFFLFMASEADYQAQSREFVWKIINFVILFGLIAYFLYEPIRNFLEKRSQDIDFSIRESKQKRKDAEKKLLESKIRLEKIAKEVEKIRRDSEIEGRKEKERILQVAKEEADRIKRIAQQEIETIAFGLSRELREYVAELAVLSAQKKIQKKLTPKNHVFLIDKSIERLEKLYEESSSGKEIYSGPN